LASIVAALSPLSRCHYIMSSYTPFATDLDENFKSVRKSSVLDIMRRLLQPKNLLASVGSSRKNSYLSIFDIIRGDVSAQEIHTSLTRIKEKKLAQFVPWGPSQFNVAITRQPANAKNRMAGLMLSNNTSITAVRSQKRFKPAVLPSVLATQKDFGAVRQTQETQCILGAVQTRSHIHGQLG
jgi:tubulin gamma